MNEVNIVSSEWQQFMEKIPDTPISGLPTKQINVDNDSVSFEQLCGQNYSTSTMMDVINLEPKLCCPNCKKCTTGSSIATPLYLRDLKTSSGKSHKGALPSCPVAGLNDAIIMLYALEPCGCKVSAEWAGALAFELKSRLAGFPPAPVIDMTEEQRHIKCEKFEKWLTSLYSAQRMAGDAETKKDIDYWIVVVIDQIQRLFPGKHNISIPKPLDVEVRDWANSNKFEVVKFDHKFDPTKGWPPPANMFFTPELENDFGYGPDYKAPPGYKSNKSIEADSLIASHAILPNGYHFIVKWSDGYAKTYVSFNEARMHGKALAKSVSGVERNRASALLKILPDIESALVYTMSKAKLTDGAAYIEPLPSEINFYGAKEEEKAVYFLKETTKVDVSFLNIILAWFETNKGMMTDLIQKCLLNDSSSLTDSINVAANIVNNIKKFLYYNHALTPETMIFVQAFSYMYYDQKKIKPIPVDDPPRTNRHHKKKRTIRQMEDD